VSDSRLEIGAHAGRDRVRPGVVGPHLSGDGCEPFESGFGVGAHRGDGHDAQQAQGLLRGDVVGQPGQLPGHDPTSRGIIVQADLREDIQVSLGAHRSGRQRRRHLGPIHGVDDIGVARDRTGLVGLYPPDEVPGERGYFPRPGGKLRHFGPRLLVAALADVGHADRGQAGDVGGRKPLRDGHEGDRPRITAHLGGRIGEAAAHGRECSNELGPATRVERSTHRFMT
jgi:hypothetical protein